MYCGIVLPDATQKLQLALQVLEKSTALETLNRNSFLPCRPLCKVHDVSMPVISKRKCTCSNITRYDSTVCNLYHSFLQVIAFVVISTFRCFKNSHTGVFRVAGGFTLGKLDKCRENTLSIDAASSLIPCRRLSLHEMFST